MPQEPLWKELWCTPTFAQNFFTDLVVWIIKGWIFCILDGVSDKCSYFLKPCCNCVFKVSVLSLSTKAMEGNCNLWIFINLWLYVYITSRLAFQRETALYSCLNVKELIARNRLDIWDFKWQQRNLKPQPLSS